jgi:hypothetical protein
MTRFMTRLITTWPALALAAGCAPPASDEPDVDSTTAPITTAITHVVKEMPAVDRQRYPDSIGYLYQGALTTIVWMQNDLHLTRIEDLPLRLERGMERGLTGEVVVNAMQRVAPVGATQPSLTQLARGTIQSMRLLGQYASSTRDYAQSLGTALAAYNTNPVRLAAIASLAGTVNTALANTTPAHPAPSLPAPLPPAAPRMVEPGRYFADAVQDGQRSYLARRVRTLHRALATRNVAAYGPAFAEVFFAQRTPVLRDTAREALAVHHDSGVLRGHPLDPVIAQHVVRTDLGQGFTMEQLRLVNQINLLSADTTLPRVPLVAALLLIDEDHRHDQEDPELSIPAIWAHVHDTTWLVAQYVRVKADGTTAADALAAINHIVESL